MGSACAQAVGDVLNGRIDLTREPPFAPIQATLLGVHPLSWGGADAPEMDDLIEQQLATMPHSIDRVLSSADPAPPAEVPEHSTPMAQIA
jgi:hypothetical protein